MWGRKPLLSKPYSTRKGYFLVLSSKRPSVEVATPVFWDLTPSQSWTRQSPDANPKALENPKFTQKRFFLITPRWSFIVTSTPKPPRRYSSLHMWVVQKPNNPQKSGARREEWLTGKADRTSAHSDHFHPRVFSFIVKPMKWNILWQYSLELCALLSPRLYDRCPNSLQDSLPSGLLPTPAYKVRTPSGWLYCILLPLNC